MSRRGGYLPMILVRAVRSDAPRGVFREVKPEPPVDTEAEVKRLEEQRKPQDEWTRALLDFED